jgi:hypothetical protein
MNFDEETDELTAYSEDQMLLFKMLEEGKLTFEDEDGYPLLYQAVTFMPNGHIFIGLKITGELP